MPHRSRTAISAAEARRLALAAQGFADPPPTAEPGGWDLRRVLSRVGLLQIDSVNVLERAHYLPAFSRLGPYSTERLDALSARAPRRLFEYWGHEASLIPVALHPLLRWRMERAHHDAWGGMRRIKEEKPDLVDEVLAEVRERGPIAASELSTERPRRSGPWWDWSESKRALEWLFWAGEVSAARRRRFERLYDVPERVIPAAVLAEPTPPAETAQRELLRIAARSLGVAAERDLRDYFRLPAAESKLRVAEMVDAGDLIPVEVEGWGRTPGYLDPGARIPANRLGAGADRPVRPADLGAQPGRAGLRLQLPARDLRAGAEARLRLLRAAVPARRPARRTRRPQGRPRRRSPPRKGRPPRARGPARDAGCTPPELERMAAWLKLAAVSGFRQGRI